MDDEREQINNMTREQIASKLDEIDDILLKMDEEKEPGKYFDQNLYDELDERAKKLQKKLNQVDAEEAHIRRMTAGRDARRKGGGYAAPLRF